MAKFTSAKIGHNMPTQVDWLDLDALGVRTTSSSMTSCTAPRFPLSVSSSDQATTDKPLFDKPMTALTPTVINPDPIGVDDLRSKPHE
ncbi:hypothetical protein F1880_009421 [Penicillium rolfsii]|nr:hypothetical protein F1880_009421 [Penicillium rolfsii]